MWNKNERSGAIDQAKGRAKQAVGALTGNDKLKATGQVDEIVGKVEATIGRASRKVGAAVNRMGKAATKGKPRARR